MPRKKSYISGHLESKRIKSIFSRLSNLLEEFGLDNFDTIVCCGISGMIAAPYLAAKFNKELLIVRKNNDKTHSECVVESSGKGCHKYIIIDDLIASGDTIKHIKDSIYNFKNKRAKCVGIFLYFHVLKNTGEIRYEHNGVPVRSVFS